MDDKTRAWFDTLTDDQRRIADALRTLVVTRAPTLTEAIKWGQPCYTGTTMVCYIRKAKGHVSLGFGRGVDLDPARKCLQEKCPGVAASELYDASLSAPSGGSSRYGLLAVVGVLQWFAPGAIATAFVPELTPRATM